MTDWLDFTMAEPYGGLIWFRTYSPWIFGSLLPSLIIGLSLSPRTTGVAKILKNFLYLFSILTFKDEQGTFKMPMSLPKKKEVTTSIITVLLLGVWSCSAGSTQILRNVGGDLIDCGASAIATEVTNLMPAVSAIVRSESPNWDAQLRALESLGAGSVACAVNAVLRRLSSELRAGPEDFRAIDHCRKYLETSPVKPAPVKPAP